MQDHIKKRLQSLAHLVLALAAVILILIVLGVNGNLLDGNTWEAVTLNIATEMLGVFFVFLLLNKLLLGDEINLSERVLSLLNKLEQTEKHPSAMQYFITKPQIAELFQTANNVDLVGVALAGTIRSNLNVIYDGARVGKQYRIVVIDPESIGLENAVVRGRIKDRAYYLETIQGILADMSRLQTAVKTEGLPGSIEVRLAQQSTSFGIKGFDLNKPNGRMYVEIFPHKASHSPILELETERDGEWYQYFLQQFETIWELAKPFEYDDKPINL